MKTLIIALVVLLGNSAANACIGGNLLQVVKKDGTVVANYNVVSGVRVAKITGYDVLSVTGDKKKSLCKRGVTGCATLVEFDKQDIVVTVKSWSKSMKNKPEAIKIKDAIVGRGVPVYRGIPEPTEDGQDLATLVAYHCAKK